MNLKYTVLSPDAIVPTQHARDKSVIDLYCPRLTVVGPERRVTIDTCIGLHFPADSIGLVVPCEQFRAEFGVFDNDCRGSIRVVVRNESDRTLEIRPGQVVAQMIVIPYVWMTSS